MTYKTTHTAEFHQIQEMRIQNALHLIKLHITEAHTEQNQDLHNAVQLIVDFARLEGDYCGR
jgi:hypothetical protein